MIDFKHKSPGFTAEGTEPPESLKTEGFKQGYKPPAGFFNWFWTLVSNCITEIQTILARMAQDDLSNVDDETFRDKAVNAGVGGVPIVEAISTDGVAYTATVDGVTELYNGLLVTIIPNMTSTDRSVTINVNGLGDKMIRVPLSFNTAAMDRPKLDTFFVEGRPTMIQFDANYVAGGLWKTVEKQKTSAQDLYGYVPVESGGTGAADAATALKNLGLTATAEELNYMDGVTENVQTQIDRINSDIGDVVAEALQVTGAASTIVANNVTASRALVSNADGKVAVSPVTATELGYLDGVTSNVQTQINGKLGTSANAASATKLATARTIRTNLGSTSTASFDGSANVTPGVTGTLPVANGGTGASDAAAARTALGITPDNIGAVKKTGDTMTGALILANGATWTPIRFERTIDGVLHEFEIAIDANKAYVTRRVGGEVINAVYLYNNSTVAGKPVTVESGGTGATDAATARTKLGITPANIGAAPTTHNHTKSEITDFPTSMPASDVYSWAKAASKPTYTASEVGAAAASHNHSASNITSGTLPVERGGTGATDAATARTKLGITPANIGASATGHKHSKSEITDFPTSMPASDVSAWAKASAKPTYTASEVGAVSKSGDTMTGSLYNNGVVEAGTGQTYALRMQGSTDRASVSARDADGNSVNYLMLYPDKSALGKPLTIEGGGTGAATKKAARKNLGAEIQVGTVDDVGTSGVQVTFSDAFSGVPVVTATGGSENASVYVRNITKTGFTLISGSGNNDGVQWQAIYITN